MSPSPSLLIVEDDAIIAGNLFSFFEKRGFVVDAAYDGRTALHRLATTSFDVVVLDVGLPGIDGLTVLHRMRNTLGLATPVLMLTARDDIADKLAGFEHGADDYVTKPFVLVEVEARVRALLARASGRVASPLRQFDRLVIDGRRHEVRVGDRPVRLTPKGWSILEALLRDPGRVVPRAELETAAWGDDPPDTDALRGQVHLLRKALADAGFDGVRTVHGIGWQLVGGGDAAP
ncbi:MAG: response regulator transcription factor [Dokdonella sp.]